MKTITLIGNLGKDPEIKLSTNQKSYATFSLAVQDGYGDKKTTEWYNCAVFSESTVKVVENYVKKGSKIAIIGTPKIEEYEDKQGQKQKAFKVIVGQIELLGSKEAPAETTTAETPAAETDTDNLPF